MNTPLPSAVPSTNVTLKEDVTSSSSDSTSCSILKTAAGDVVLSIFSSEGAAPASLSSLATFALAQISAIASNNANLFQDCAHNVIFLSPETIEVEIQIADLLQTLETINLQTTSEEKTSCKKQEQNLLQKGYEPREVAPKSAKDIQGSSKTLQQPSKAFSGHASAKTSDSRSWTNSLTIPHTLEQFRSQASHSSTPSQQPRTEKDSDLISYQSYPACTTEKKEQQIFTTKSQESKQGRGNRDQKQDQQRNGQNQEENNQEKQREKKYKSQSNVDKSKKTSSQLSIAQLRYFDDVRQSREINIEEEKTFKKKVQSPMSLFASATPTQRYASIQTPKIENVFIRFMKLMARILGQAEAEAQELYLRVKERTDNVDTLTLLVSKINSEKGAIDWRDNSEMKALIDQARKLDVTISDTLQWTEEEKKLLKENIQMRKENMEKITQIERTDMQRHLQEVSQCHQARSNVLKLLKELMDTFIYNLRP
ncbi:hypothetical protein [Chlamydia psittaci]|uniref:hypothetical protein n=1 Tax=Chlamydia psittaci TaxID=83554 RepID=UPI00027E12A8|nr:hypothetical protein [Chlamydia psittaci]AFS24964.1 hypothetical protein B602_0793 [Chlamydia psittaci M56]